VVLCLSAMLSVIVAVAKGRRIAWCIPCTLFPPLIVVLILLLGRSVAAGESPVLRLDSLGIPATGTQAAGRRINDLIHFDGRLFIGTGDYSVNTGPMAILNWDPATGKFAREGRVDDEAIHKFCVVSDRLVIPGVDATDSWDLGNVYVREEGRWTKHRSVPRGIHVFDVVSWRGRWWTATGTWVEPVADAGIGCGGVLSSADRGATWQFDVLSPADRRGFWRYGWLAVFQDRLFAFPYALAEVPTERVPEAARPHAGPARRGVHTLFVPDPMGAADVLVTDGGAWRPVDLVPAPNVVKVSPILFADRLLLSVVTGEWVPSYAESLYRDRRLPEGARAALFAFDGEKTTRIDFPHDFLVDAVTTGDRLALLVLRDGRYLLAETADLSEWRVHTLAVGNGHPLSIERIGTTWYVGMKDGNLLRSVGTAPAGSVAQPDGFEILAELPRDGVGPWAAIVATVDPVVRARLAVRREGSRVTVDAANVAGFLVFLGDAGIADEATLEIDGKEAFRGKLGAATALAATRGAEGWTVKPVAGSAAGFRPEPRVVATATVELTRAGDDPTIGLLVADAIRAAAGADVAILNRGTVRRDLPAGPIHAADVNDLVYRNRIATFRVRGGVFREMLAKNFTAGGRNRVQFAGFTAVWSKADGLVECSIEPEREYTVALPDWTAENAEELFGRAVEFTAGDTLVRTAVLTWLRDHPEVGKIEPRLTLR